MEEGWKKGMKGKSEKGHRGSRGRRQDTKIRYKENYKKRRESWVRDKEKKKWGFIISVAILVVTVWLPVALSLTGED